MAANPYNLTAADLRYGHVCPRCAGPKTLQAARCRRCYADDRRLHRDRRRSVPSAVCACGRRMCSTSKQCRHCWLAGEHPQPQDHPWRRTRRLAYV